jgi:spore photoproduct lyase
MKKFIPIKVFIEGAAAGTPRAKRILQKLSGQDVVWIEDHRNVDFSSLPINEQFIEAKKCLAVAVKQGAMVKEFRRHDSLKQDKEYYLLHAANCPFDCSYCYLQCYFENAVPTIYVNYEDLFQQVDVVVKERPAEEILFHAGETADALALEHLSGFAVEAVEYFSHLDGASLELRTKSDLVEPLLPLEHNGRTVVSWTLTPEEISQKYETGTASIVERVQAAGKCLSAGYLIGLRFDPIIHYSGWKKGYKELFERVFDVLPIEGIDSIVLGTFRFPPHLLDVMRERFGRNELILGEFISGSDGKMRYFRHIREEMYRQLVSMLQRRLAASITSKIELAMEPGYVWKAVFEAL